MTGVIVGIDLGTTSYSIAIYSNNVVHPLKDYSGATRNRCCVSYTLKDNESEVQVGDLAYMMQYYDRDSLLVYEPKRLIGHKYEDLENQALLEWLPYSVNKKPDGVEIVIQRGPKIIITTPFSMYQSILNYIKQCIRKTMGQVRRIHAVITVPPAFTREQRNATLAAAESVGFQVLELLDDPTAIALSYFSKHETLKKDDYFLVYDLGASNFKIGIFKVTENSFEFVSATSSTGISGQDFDFIIFDYICDQLWRLLQFDVRLDKDVIRLVLMKSERAKRHLSEVTNFTIILQNIPPGNVMLEISKNVFEKIANNFFCKTINIADWFLNDHNISKDNIKKIILYGGLSKTPKIRQLFYEHFGDKILEELVFENTSVAEGAALHAAKLLKAFNNKTSI